MVFNTAGRLQRVPQDHLDRARVQHLSAWNKLDVQHILIDIFVIGIVGLLRAWMRTPWWRSRTAACCPG